MSTPKAVQDYFHARMFAMGITPAHLAIELYYDTKPTPESNLTYIPRKKSYAIFEPCEKGIAILLYNIEREVCWFRTQKAQQKTTEYRQIRLLEPKIKEDGSVQKYDLKRGQKTLPFFPPPLLDKYEQQEKITTLYLTEGYFKAFKAQMHGIDCVGLPSITCLKNAQGLIHTDIEKLIQRCKVERIVWLMDGDCRAMSTKEITPEHNLTQRISSFYGSVTSFYDLFSKSECRLYFAHINTEQLSKAPKGLDDLLIAYPEVIAEIQQEFLDFRLSKEKRFLGNYHTRLDITNGTHEVYKYFNLTDVETFYSYQVEFRPELKTTAFQFFGTTYQHQTATGKCEVLIPKNATDYFRVGDTYYKYINIPDQWGKLSKTFEKRERKTIVDDHSKELLKHVSKYEAFCSVPAHLEYQQAIHNCYNLYRPFEWELDQEAQQEDCMVTLRFLKHIFGTEKKFIEKEEDYFQKNLPNNSLEKTAVENWELALDYLQLLFLNPQQMLPILCLVSRERQTGKTTFFNWLKQIYKDNMAIVGNADLAGDFNAHWISKLIVAVDETKIDKHTVMEKIKSLSTAMNAMLNAKQKDQKEIKIFLKFILNSNNEENFINIEEEEIRFWVIKVPTFQEGQREVRMLEHLTAEIPAFLYFLSKRKMVTRFKERHWFDSELLQTEALRKVIKNSKPSLEKTLQLSLAELFDASDSNTIYMPLGAIAELVKKVNDKNYIKEILHKLGYQASLHATFKYYPRLVEQREGQSNTPVIRIENVKFKNRYYTFERKDCTTIE